MIVAESLEVHLDQKLKRMLGMLIRLRDRGRRGSPPDPFGKNGQKSSSGTHRRPRRHCLIPFVIVGRADRRRGRSVVEVVRLNLDSNRRILPADRA